VDPTTVTVTVQDPDLNQTTTTATRDSVGTYHLDIVLTLAGSWFYRFIATGIVVAQTEDIEIVVAPRRF
jgi:VCBS repeat-containing protein